MKTCKLFPDYLNKLNPFIQDFLQLLTNGEEDDELSLPTQNGARATPGGYAMVPQLPEPPQISQIVTTVTEIPPPER